VDDLLTPAAKMWPSLVEGISAMMTSQQGMYLAKIMLLLLIIRMLQTAPCSKHVSCILLWFITLVIMVLGKQGKVNVTKQHQFSESGKGQKSVEDSPEEVCNRHAECFHM
jgi:hypothetical protein